MIHCSGLTWRNIKRIGLFDSGVGGLSVLRSLVSRLDQSGEKEFVYIGDTLRCPYGDRPGRQITSYVKQLTSWLLKHDIDAIIMACNTSTAAGKDELVRYSPVPVLDLIDPTAALIAQRGIKKVGVLATAATARKQAFSSIIHSIDPTIKVTEIGCPLLVPVVEAGLGDAHEAQEALKPYVRELIDNEVEAIVYGCTHYPFLDTALKNVLSSMGNYPALIIDPADCLASDLSGKSTGAVALQPDAFASTRFATTGDAETFGRIASRCLKQNVGQVESVTLSELTAAFVLRRLQKRAIAAAAPVPAPIPLITPEAVS